MIGVETPTIYARHREDVDVRGLIRRIGGSLADPDDAECVSLTVTELREPEEVWSDDLDADDVLLPAPVSSVDGDYNFRHVLLGCDLQDVLVNGKDYRLEYELEFTSEDATETVIATWHLRMQGH